MLHTESLGWMEKSKLATSSLYCDSFQFVLKLFISKISKENAVFLLKTVNQTKKKKKKKAKQRVRSLQSVWLLTLPF